MAYIPTVWKNRIVEFPRRFVKQNETASSVELVPDPGVVTEEGTPVNAVNLNKIEQGIEDAHDAIDAHEGRTDNPHGVTKSQVGLSNVQNYGIASQAQAEAGSANNVYMTPLRTKNYVDTRLLNGLKLRINEGTLEFWDGTGWKSMGGFDPTKMTVNFLKGGSGSSQINVPSMGAVDLHTIAGSGVLSELTLYFELSENKGCYALVIDGVEHELNDNQVNNNAAIGPFLNGNYTLGTSSGSRYSIFGITSPIPFHSSLVIRLKNKDTSNRNARTAYQGVYYS